MPLAVTDVHLLPCFGLSLSLFSHHTPHPTHHTPQHTTIHRQCPTPAPPSTIHHPTIHHPTIPPSHHPPSTTSATLGPPLNAQRFHHLSSRSPRSPPSPHSPHHPRPPRSDGSQTHLPPPLMTQRMIIQRLVKAGEERNRQGSTTAVEHPGLRHTPTGRAGREVGKWVTYLKHPAMGDDIIASSGTWTFMVK